MQKKIIASIFIMMLLLNVTSVYASTNIWKTIEDASAYEKNDNLDRAFPLWQKIIQYFEKKEQTTDNATNLAIFYKKVGHYYDDQKIYDKAVEAYEKENSYWNMVGKNWGAKDMERAEEIRTTFEYFVKEASPSNKSLEKYEPAAGVYLGIYPENDPAIGQDFYKTKTVYGNHALYLLYQDWGKTFDYDFSSNHAFDSKLAKKIKNEDAGLQLALNAPEGLTSVQKDEWIINWAKEAQKLDMPIFLRFLGEMNGDWVRWNGNPALYIKKFRLVHNIMQEYAPNVVMVWTPNDVPIETDGIRIEDYYPGDDYVDWIGVNFYIDYYDSGDASKGNNKLQNPLSHLDYIYTKYANRKPIMICETGVTHYSIPTDEDLTPWAKENLKKLYTQLPMKYPRVKAINYFSLNQANSNYTVGNRWNNYALSENDTIHSIYKEIINNKNYIGKINNSSDSTYRPIKSPEAFKSFEEVFFYIKIPDYKISAVEFYDGDRKIAVDKSLPFSLKTDFSKIDTLKIRVFDSNNTLNLVKTLELKNTPEIETSEELAEDTAKKKELPQTTEGNISVSVPSFAIQINGKTIDNKKSKYPFLTYKGITYFPMTYNYSQALGLNSSWNATTGLIIIQKDASKTDISPTLGGNNTPEKKLLAKFADYNITVNGKTVDNSSEEYPLFSYNDITYFPMTWKFSVEEFGWNNTWSEATGLKINAVD